MRSVRLSREVVSEKLRHVPVSWRIIIGLFGLGLLGTLLLMLPAAATHEPLSFTEALFTASSALSCTGLSVIVVASDLSVLGQWILLGLIQIGGIGYMTLAILVLRILGRQISLADRLALQDALGVVNVSGVFTLARYVFFTVVSIELAGMVALRIHWGNVGLFPEQDLWFQALFHSVSSFCNAGFDLISGNPATEAVFPMDNMTLLIKGMLIFLGGIGMPVLFDLVSKMKVRKALLLHTKLTLSVAVFLLLVGFAMLFVTETRPGGTLHNEPIGRQLALSLFQSISCRSAGFVGLPSFESVTPAGQQVMLTLMFIGSAPASAGGGITTGTFAVLMLAVVAYARGLSTPRVLGRAIPGDMVRKAAAVLTVSLGVVGLNTFLLLLTHPVPLQVALFEIVSAFATCGLTLNFSSQLTPFGQVVVASTMLYGRLGALTIVYALTHGISRTKVFYPEEKVLIG